MRDFTQDEPAFPAEGGSDSGLHANPGMSIRDYFAASAMQGLISNPNNSGSYTELCQLAYKIADEMMDRRSK